MQQPRNTAASSPSPSDHTITLVDAQTLADLAGAADLVEAGVQGSSFAGLFDDPTQPPPGLQAFAQSQFPKCGCATGKHGYKMCGNCIYTNRTDIEYMGYSIRTTVRPCPSARDRRGGVRWGCARVDQ